MWPVIVSRFPTPALDGSILLKFLLETWLKSESFEPFIGFLSFLVEKLWPKKHKIGNFTLTEPEPKWSKAYPTHDVTHKKTKTQNQKKCFFNAK